MSRSRSFGFSPPRNSAQAARRAIVGLAISNGGTWIQRVSLDVLLLELGGAGSLAAGVVLQQLPSAVLFKPTGWLADRFDRRKLLVSADVALAFIALFPAVFLVLVAEPTAGPLLGFAAVSGVFVAAEATARHTLLGELAIAAGKPRLLALAALVPNLGRMVGPAVGALVIVARGHPTAHLLNVASFLLAGLLISTLSSSGAPARSGRTRAGVARAVTAAGALPHLALLGWAFLFTQGTRVYLPLLVSGSEASMYGLLLMLVGAGGGVAAFVTWRLPRFTTTGAGAWSAMLLPFAVVALLPRAPVLTVLGTLSIGFLTSTLTVGTRVVVNQQTPEGMRGQVSAAVIAAIQGSIPLSAVVTSAWLTAVGLSPGLLSMQVAACAGGMAILRWRGTRRSAQT